MDYSKYFHALRSSTGTNRTQVDMLISPRAKVKD
jgi:hypothetical protein